MGWKSDNNGSDIVCRKLLGIFNCVIKCVECVLNKRFHINIIVFLLSVALIAGFFCSINDNEYWKNTFNTVTNETSDKVKLIGNNFVVKTQIKIDTSIQLAYNNSKNAISEKSFHQMPKVNIRSKTSIIDIFTKKSFSTIDDSKKLRLGELKWKFFSKMQ